MIQLPSKVPLWSLSQRNAGLGYIAKTVDVRKLDILIPKEVPAEDFRVVFPCHADLSHVCKHRSTSEFVRMGSVVLRLAEKLTKQVPFEELLGILDFLEKRTLHWRNLMKGTSWTKWGGCGKRNPSWSRNHNAKKRR